MKNVTGDQHGAHLSYFRREGSQTLRLLTGIFLRTVGQEGQHTLAHPCGRVLQGLQVLAAVRQLGRGALRLQKKAFLSVA